MQNKILAPIVIFTYNRLDTLIYVIEYLIKNSLSQKSDLIIYSDHPRKDKDLDAVNKVREFLHKIDGFNSIKIIERKENYGLAKNIIQGVTEILDQYEKVIVLEDDLITSPNFLDYMNQCLDYYKDDEKIFAVSGFCWDLPTLKNIEEDIFIAYRPASWGWATWKHQWNDIDWNIKDYDSCIKDRKAIKKFNRGGMDMTRMLKHFKEGKNNSWAIRWAYSMSNQDKYCIYPKLSKVQNIGYGLDATHCTGEHIHLTILDESINTDFKFSKDLILNKKLLKEFRYQNSYVNKAIKKLSSKLKNIFKGKR